MIRLSGALIPCLFCTVSMAADLSAEVTKVISGDTLTAVISGTTKTIRLGHVECPPPSEPIGAQAKQMTEQACLGKTVQIQVIKDRKTEGLDADILLDKGKTLSVRLLEEGLARLKEPAYAPMPLRKAFLQGVAREKGLHARGARQAPEPEPIPSERPLNVPAEEAPEGVAPPSPVDGPISQAGEETLALPPASVPASPEKTVPPKRMITTEGVRYRRWMLWGGVVLGIAVAFLAGMGAWLMIWSSLSKSAARKSIRLPEYVLVIKDGARPQSENVFLTGTLKRYAPELLSTPGTAAIKAVYGDYSARIDDAVVAAGVEGAFRAGGWPGDRRDYDIEWFSVDHTDGTAGAVVYLYPKVLPESLIERKS